MITFLSKIFKINNVNVIGISRGDDGNTYRVLSFKKSRSKITVVARECYSSFDELSSKINSKLPVLLVFDGKGVLNKRIEYANEADLNWKKNIDYNSIFFTSYTTEKDNFISFCRKNVIDEIVNDFKDINVQIVGVYVGSFLAALLKDSIHTESVVSGELDLEFDNDVLVGFNKNESNILRKYTIGGDEISQKELPLYGVLLHFLLNPDTVEKTNDSSLNVEEILYKRAFNALAVFMLGGFLISLLTSYLLVQYFGSKNNELNLQNVYSNQSFQKILDLEKQREEKLNIINQSGTFSNKFLTYYAYELVNNVPSSISFNELNVFPSGKEVKAGKKINFESNTIRIKGATVNEDSLNDWLNKVKQNTWVKSFEIVSIKKDKNNTTLFEIKMVIKNV